MCLVRMSGLVVAVVPDYDMDRCLGACVKTCYL